MTASTTLTPYDTGDRCEPKLWQPDAASVRFAMNHDETADIGKVDFDDDEAHTVVTVYLARHDDGSHTVHVIPFVDEDELSVTVHSEPVV